MNHRHHVPILAAILIALGLGLFWYKAVRVGLPLKANIESDIWTVETRVSFVGDDQPVKVKLRIPNQPAGFGVLDENFVSRGFGLTTSEDVGNRVAQWSRRSARGPHALYYRASVYRDSSVIGANDIRVEPPTVPLLEEPQNTAMNAIVTSVRDRSADTGTFTEQLLKRLNRPELDENVRLFVEEKASRAEIARAAQTILAGARIASRIAQGIELRQEPHFAQVQPWLEVFDGARWLHFNLTDGQRFEADNRLTWYYGTSPLLLIDGRRTTDIDTEIFVRRDVVDALSIAEQRATTMGSHAI
ncbi:MAG: UUP1 family membrane protein, partial [Pseudomonadota bacterium]